LLLVADGSLTLDQVGVTLSISTPARVVLVAANVCLFCAAVMAWMSEDEVHSPDHEWGLLLATLTSSLLAGAALANDRIVSALCLLGAGLAASSLAMARPRSPIPATVGNDEHLRAHVLLARRFAGGLKHIGLATLGTGLLAVGTVLVARYAFNLENRGLLQFGLALLATGIVVRAGSMPFAAASADAIQATPSASLMMLGAGAPVALVVGLLMFAPVEGSLAGGAVGGWLGAVGVLLAGMRALGVVLEGRVRSEPHGDSLREVKSTSEANLIAATVAASTGWAIFGVLSGSQAGAVGAVLIAANMALALPIVVMGRRWLAVGVASLLGLPPFGGFAGMVLVAGSAANAGGIWPVILLAGSALVATGWLALAARDTSARQANPGWRQWLADPAYLFPTLLVLAQIAFFLASLQLIAQLDQWATVPWLVSP
jgi:formate hydrogenlyase subunit 3/multisubunit Na+/H+ antiporter MnhD subunit